MNICIAPCLKHIVVGSFRVATWIIITNIDNELYKWLVCVKILMNLYKFTDESFKAVSTAFKQQKGSVEKLQSKLKTTEEQKSRLSSNMESHSHQLNVNFRFL